MTSQCHGLLLVHTGNKSARMQVQPCAHGLIWWNVDYLSSLTTDACTYLYVITGVICIVSISHSPYDFKWISKCLRIADKPFEVSERRVLGRLSKTRTRARALQWLILLQRCCCDGGEV